MLNPVTTVIGTSIVVIVIIHLFKQLFTHYSWVYKIMNLPTLPNRAYPLIGHLYLFPKEVGKVYFKWMSILLDGAKQQGQKFVVFWISSIPVCAIVNPDAAETILKSNVNIEKPQTYETSVNWLGDGLVLSKGEKWFHRRRLLTPSFHFKILDDFLNVMNEQADIFVSNLAKLKDHNQVDIINAVTLCTLDIICETAMGIQINAQENTRHYYVHTLERMAEVNRQKLKYPWYNINTIFKYSKLGRESAKLASTLQMFTRNIIEQRLEENKKNEGGIKSKKMAFLDMMMNARTEKGERLSAGDLQEEVDTFMFAGHDTNATAMIWTLYLLGQHPEVQEKLQKEIDEVFPGGNPIKVTSDDISKLQYMEMVIKESLRLFPPVSMIGRCLSEDTVVDGYKIPTGTICYIMIFAMHRNPDIWDSPKEFRPERFDKNTTARRHPFAFVPFSAGPRNCIGQRFAMNEQKVILTKFLKTFNVATNVKEEDLDISIGLVTRPMNLTYKLTKRVK